MTEHLGDLQLGRVTPIPTSPLLARIDVVPNPGWSADEDINFLYIARFHTDEMTSICPVTNAPDFGTLIIDYMPHEHLIESKSLKLFLASFRNAPGFHEAATCLVGKRLWEAAKPFWLRVIGLWNKRGGIGIDVVWEEGERRDNTQPLSIDHFLKRYA